MWTFWAGVALYVAWPPAYFRVRRARREAAQRIDEAYLRAVA